MSGYVLDKTRCWLALLIHEFTVGIKQFDQYIFTLAWPGDEAEHRIG